MGDRVLLTYKGQVGFIWALVKCPASFAVRVEQAANAITSALASGSSLDERYMVPFSKKVKV